MKPIHSVPIDLKQLPSRQMYGTATLTPLAVSSSDAPAAALLEVDAGRVVPPHFTKSGLRLLTVLSGELSWGVGSEVDEAQEVTYPPGSMLTIPAGLSHWVAARNGTLRVQLVVLDPPADVSPVPEILEQMK